MSASGVRHLLWRTCLFLPTSKSVRSTTTSSSIVDAFKDRLPSRFGDRGPKIVEITGESVDRAWARAVTGTQQAWEIDGVHYPSMGLNAVAGKPKEEIGLEPGRASTEMRPGCYDIDERIKDMDQDGIHAQLCFPSLPGFAGSTFFNMKDKDLAARLCPGVERLRHRRVVCGVPGAPDPAGDPSRTGTPT